MKPNPPPPRRIRMTYTLSVDFEVPTDFPVSVEEIRKVAEWRTNDHRDGRQNFSTELMKDGVERAARGQFHDAIDENYCRRIDKAFGNANFHMEARDALIRRCSKTVSRGYVVHDIDITVKSYPVFVTCHGCGQPTPSEWGECPCSPGVKLDEYIPEHTSQTET